MYSLTNKRLRIKKRELWSYAVCLLMLLGLYSIGTLSSMVESWTPTLVIFAVAIITSIFSIDKLLSINKKILVWLPFLILCFFYSVYADTYTDITFYVISLLLVILVSRWESNTLKFLYLVIFIFGMIFAFGVFWQYLFPNMYESYYYPFFADFYKQSINRQFFRNQMCTGFTSQTVVSAQYIIMGLYSFLCWMKAYSKKYNILSICCIVVLFAALLLTGKRSSLIFLMISWLYVELKTDSLNDKLKKIVIFILCLGILVFIIQNAVALELFDTRNTIVRLFETTQDGEDISNGRFALYSVVWEKFLQHPFLGSGWGWVGNFTAYNGAHNIYLQLLCECGIIGLLVFVLAIVNWFFNTLDLNRGRRLEGHDEEQAAFKFSLFTQTFFIIYGLVGNPLYDFNYLIWYIIAIGISMSNINKLKGAKACHE